MSLLTPPEPAGLRIWAQDQASHLGTEGSPLTPDPLILMQRPGPAKVGSLTSWHVLRASLPAGDRPRRGPTGRQFTHPSVLCTVPGQVESGGDSQGQGPGVGPSFSWPQPRLVCTLTMHTEAVHALL